MGRGRKEDEQRFWEEEALRKMQEARQKEEGGRPGSAGHRNGKRVPYFGSRGSHAWRGH